MRREHICAATSVAFCSCFGCTHLQRVSECNNKHEMNDNRSGGVFISLRGVIYHGILKLMVGSNFTRAGTVNVVKMLHKLREWGTRLGGHLRYKLEYAYLAQYCLISLSLPCLTKNRQGSE